MTTAYTSLLGLALPVTGELSGTWGDTVNNSITSLLDSAIAGTQTITADTTLTTTTGAANQSRQAILLCSPASANITITAPAQSKIYTVINTSGTYTVKIRGVGPTTGVTLAVSESAVVAWNGTDFIRISSSNSTTGNFTVNGNLVVTGNTTLGDADTDTITQTASYVTGTQLKSAKTATNTLNLAAYDTDGAAYTNLITLTASTTPTLALTSTGVGTINNMSVGATTASTGAFTTLSATGNTTLGDAAADTVTVNGTVTSNLIFTDNTYDIGASGATRPRNLYLSGLLTMGGALTVNGNTTIGDADTDTITQAASYVTGTQLKSAKTATNTLNLAAYDVDGTAYTNLITLTASNTPTLTLTSTGVGTINNMSIGATTTSTGAFTTLSATGAVTANTTTNAQSYTTTGAGTITISSGTLGTINNMSIGATTASTGAFTTLSATGNTTIGDADTDTITQAASYVTGTQLKSAKTATNTLSLAAYDVDGTAYTNLITLTASNTPTLALTSTGVGTINNMSVGATTASTGAFTTLTSNGATTFTAGTASTTTGTGTLVITGGLGVSGRINAANFDGIVGANTAAAGTFTTLSSTGNTTIGDAVADTITVNGQFVTGTVLRSAQTATNTLALAAYDTDGAAYTNLITLTASTTPTLALTSTGVGTINNMSVGATTASTGAFTTLSATGNITLGDADTDTITQAASYVTGTVLRSAKTATNTLALAAYDVDGAAYTNLITLTASNTPTLALTSTGVGTINNMSVGATTASTGAFTTLSATGVTTVQAGTALLPAITTSGDTNTGIWFPAADTIAFTEGGVESMRISSAGDVGIGTSSPSAKLDVAGNRLRIGNASSDPGIEIYNGSVVKGYLFNDTTNNLITIRHATPATGINLDSSGNVGIGTSSVTATLQVVGAGVGGTIFAQHPGNQSFGTIIQATTTGGTDNPMISLENYNAGSPVRYGISCTDSGSLAFMSGGYAASFGTERARIDSSGNLLVGTTTTGGGKVVFEATSANQLVLSNTDTGSASQYAAYFLRNNNIVGSIQTTNTATSYVTSSDYRLKESIAPMTGALATVAQLKPVTYKWKIDGSDGQGFIAHELAEVCSHAVSGEKDGEQMQGVDYGKLTPILTAALQEAISKIENLEARIAILEAK